MSERERGVAAIELALAFAVLLVPMALVVLSFAPMLEARASARTGSITAARTIVATGGDERAALSQIAATMSRNGRDPADVTVSLCGGPERPIDAPASTCLGADGALERGAVVSVELAVRVEVVVAAGRSMTLVAGHEHAELVDLYRSMSP